MTEVDRNAALVADTAFMNMVDTPHPKGYVVTMSVMLRRALFAYEWAKAEGLRDAGDGYVEIPSYAEVRAAVLEWEASDE